MILATPNSVIRAADYNANFAEATASILAANYYKSKYFCSLRKSSAATLAAGWVMYGFETVRYNIGNMFNSQTQNITIPKTGLYRLWGCASVNGGGGAVAGFYVNGVKTMEGNIAGGASNIAIARPMFDITYTLNAGDVIRFGVYTPDGNRSLELATYTNIFNIEYVGEVA